MHSCSNMFQNDIVTNDLSNGLVNDHGFEDTAISRINKYNFSKHCKCLFNDFN